MRAGRRHAILALALVLVAVRAHGATATWSGAGGDANWGTAANWTPAPPTAADVVVLPAGVHVVRTATDAGCAEVQCAGDAEIAGAPLHLGHAIDAARGRLALGCGLTLDADGELRPHEGAIIEVAAVDLGEHGLACVGEGRVRFLGVVSGAGGLSLRGPGRVELTTANGYRGKTTITGGEAWILADVEAERDGACGNGKEPILIDGGCLVDGAARFARAIVIGENGGRLDAYAKPRTIASDIVTGAWERGGLIGTYLNHSLRSVAEDDWRKRPEVTGTREDALIHFPQSAYGTAEERAKFRIAGANDNWDDFSIQWDGTLRVERDGVTISTCSDDGTRLWLDLNGDGTPQPNEWASNGWGTGQGATVRPLHGPLKAGVYRFRLQYEDGGGGNCASLLWDDREHSAGSFGGLSIVPARDYVRTPALSIGGNDYGEERGKPLTLTGAISGGATVVKLGTSEATLAGKAAWSGGTRVDGGLLVAAVEGALPDRGAITVGERGRLRIKTAQRLGALGGAGAVEIAAPLTLASDEDSEFSGGLEGSAGITKLGRGRLTLRHPVGCPIEARDGSIACADGRVMTGVALAAPLTTVVELPPGPTGPRAVELVVDVPKGAPDDLGCGVSVGDQHGHWFQRFSGEQLAPGRHEFRVALDADAILSSEPTSSRWDEATAATSTRTGIFFWSARPSHAMLRIDARVVAASPSGSAHPRLLEFGVPTGSLHTGERLEWTCRPQPFPANPYDPEEFALDAVFTAPDGSETRVPSFYTQKMSSRDRGDREEVRPAGGDCFCTRFRARQPGAWRVRWEARWRSGKAIAYTLPGFTVGGEPWDDYVRVDKQDPRFFSTGGDFYWPIGLNLHAVYDPRSRDCLGTKITPDRGLLAYDAYLTRFAAAGGTGVEIWLAAWNLGLEWRGDWTGFYGQGRYSQENAWRLDQVLDCAWRHGIRVNLVVTNHGQASEGCDPEWTNSPYNKMHGGHLTHAAEFFTDAWALRGQENYRRYLIARYADHPAIMGWKLFSEVNLTAAGEHVVEWHDKACARWHALDPYGHPTSSHWAGDWNSPDRRVVALPGLDYVCIDQYHQGGVLADMLAAGTDPQHGLGKFKKPILVTEFGGNWNAGPHPLVIAEQAYAPWAAFVTGYTAAPMTWWFEFVDQHDLWAPYGAISRFVAGEDLRGANAGSVAYNAASPAGALWCRAWQRPGRIIGYVLDRGWAEHGQQSPAHEQARIDLGAIAAGELTVEWWDADLGKPIGRDALAADGTAPLMLSPPAFQRHIAFKLWRTSPQARADAR